MLSSNKHKFMQNDGTYAYHAPLSFEDIQLLRNHYQKKHHIQIYINGETPFGQEQIEKNRKSLYDELEKFNDKDFQYAYYLLKNWLLPTQSGYDAYFISKIADSKFKDCYDNIKKSIAKFLKDDGSLRTDLAAAEMIELNDIGNRFPLIHEMLDTYRVEVKNRIQTRWIDKPQAILEIYSIQKTLEKEDVVGYIFTNGLTDRCEAVIITPKEIIKPLEFKTYLSDIMFASTDFNVPLYELSTFRDNHFFTAEQKTAPQSNGAFTFTSSNEEPVLAQTDKYISTAAIILLFLKELLKNNAQQFNAFTLRFSYYHEEKCHHLFLTSPQTLRYSQSSLFICILAALLHEEPVKVVRKNVSYNTNGLKHLLLRSIETAERKSDHRMIDANREILKNLPPFAEKWLKELKTSSLKRDAMFNVALGKNQYLTYAFSRYQTKLVAIKKEHEELKRSHPNEMIKVNTKKGTILFKQFKEENTTEDKYFPSKWPEIIKQRGYCCGPYALSSALKHGFGKEAPDARKEGQRYKVSIRSIAKKNYSDQKKPYTSYGEFLNRDAFPFITNYFKFPYCELLHVPRKDQTHENFTEIIIAKLKQKFTIIVSCDLGEGSFPGIGGGIHLHWALIFGYSRNKKGTVDFFVGQYGEYFVWNSLPLFESNFYLPVDNPNSRNKYYKEKQHDGSKKEYVVPENYFLGKYRHCHETQLNKFRFSLFAIPAPEFFENKKNNWKVPAEKVKTTPTPS